MSLSNLPRGRLVAFLLILVGALLFLDNLGFLPIGDIRAYWPLWLVIWGAVIMDNAKNAVSYVWASALIFTGILLILGNLGILHVNGGIFWPMMIIAFGVTLLIQPSNLADWPLRIRAAAEARGKARGFTSCRTGDSFHGSRVNESIVFSAVHRRVETQQFDGGKLDAVFGSIEIDLRDSAISSPDRIALLAANAVFGGIEITVPRNWKVVMKSAAVFGGCNDRTVPPRPEPGFQPVTIVITGAAVFGGIEVRN
jgi:predicted membrane protein